MRRITFFLIFIGPVFVSSSFLSIAFSSRTDFLEILLNLYSQELVAHGAMLFAASAATLRFVTGFIPKVSQSKQPGTQGLTKRKCILYVVIGGILIGLVLYLGFRITYYGSLVHTLIRSDINSTEFNSLPDYVSNISTYTKDVLYKNSTHLWRANLFKTISDGYLKFSPFGILPFSMYIGLFLSFTIFYAFSDYEIENKRAIYWFIYFLVPAFLGTWGVLSYWSESSDWLLIINRKINNIPFDFTVNVLGVILIISYVLGIIKIYWDVPSRIFNWAKRIIN